DPAELAAYQGAAIYALWDHFGDRIQKVIEEDGVHVAFWDDFAHAYDDLLGYPGLVVPKPGYLLAFLYQARRAAWFITVRIAGRSRAARKARTAIWRAIFGSDLCTYARGLYKRMHEIPVLITGETGSGKDLAAECLGKSRYIPFDPETRRFAA